MRLIAYAIWTVVVIVALVFVGNWFIKDRVFEGTVVDITTGRNLKIEGSDVTIFATSQELFLIREAKGEVKYSIPPVLPHTEYVLGPTGIEKGNWTFLQGSAVIHLTSDNPIKVTVYEANKAWSWFGMILLAFLVWFLGISITLL